MYRENNKHIIKEKEKQKYIKNKDKIKENRKQKILCNECNIEIRKDSLQRHTKTKKHMLNITIEVSQNNTAQI